MNGVICWLYVACGCLPLPCSRAKSRHQQKPSSLAGHEDEGNGSSFGASPASGANSRLSKAKRRTEESSGNISLTSVSAGPASGARRGTAGSSVSVTSASSSFCSPKERRKLPGHHHHHHHHHHHQHHGGVLQRKGGVYDRGLAGEPDPDPPHLKASQALQARSGQPRSSRRPVIRSARDLLGSCGDLSTDVEAAIKESWEPIVGNDFLVVVAQLAKFKEGGGLGISLEGTVDVEDGVEVRPHHYIRSILPDGPVGINGTLKSSDELLEVNGRRLLGLNHVSVVEILKDLPQNVRLVCARRKTPLPDTFSQPDLQIPAASSPYLPGVESSPVLTERLVKAKSEMALSTTASGSDSLDPSSLNRAKSRSLEPLTGLAMWSSQSVVIELDKGERGLGFSILDYQDPVNPSGTVIVIRSLVPGGVAQQDGRLVPGDRLVFVNDVSVEHASLDQAVQALKGAARGTVRIGVAKPLPLAQAFRQDGQFPPFYDSTMSQSLETDSQGNQLAFEGAAPNSEPVLETAVQSAPTFSQPTSQQLTENDHQNELRLDIPVDDSAELQKSLEGSDTAATSPVSQSDTSSGSLDRSAGSSKMTRSAAVGAVSMACGGGVRRHDSFYESDEDSRTPRSRRRAPASNSHGKLDVEKPPGYESAMDEAVLNTDQQQQSPPIAHASPPSPPSDRLDGGLKQTEMRTTVVSNSVQPLPSYEEALSYMTEPTLSAAAVASAAPIAKLDSTGSDSEQPTARCYAATSAKGNNSTASPPSRADVAGQRNKAAKKIPPPIPPKPKGVRGSLLTYAQEKVVGFVLSQYGLKYPQRSKDLRGKQAIHLIILYIFPDCFTIAMLEQLQLPKNELL
ncbi:multiple PDZ domain protein [Elysia marginata]|uniref:Multiple PDZ domain protein n=1 Tax=Elysia marginata TaxID=1093978 RepID=A0AAV4JIR6_9GAST|nr:multiple PDZ domain protein [Elysia marginata]